MRTSRRLLALAFLAALVGTAAAALSIPPPPDHRINDFAGVLPAAERERLEEKLRSWERESSNQIVVAIFRSLDGENLEDYSIRLAQAWRIGQKGLDNGVIFLVFVDDRKMRFEVGYGLEPKLTDALSSEILRQVVAPRFREGKIGDGIAAGLDAIEQVIAGTYKALPSEQAGRARGGGGGLLPIALLVIVVVGILSIVISGLRNSHLQGRRQGWTGGSRGWGGPIIFPGGWGGGGGGGGGGGDFGGGGGGFGGGGASGDW